MNEKQREKMRMVLDEKIIEVAQEFQNKREGEIERNKNSLANLRIEENKKMVETKEKYGVPPVITRQIFRGDIESIKQCIREKWSIRAFSKDVSESNLKIADENNYLHPDLVKHPFSFQWITLEK